MRSYPTITNTDDPQTIADAVKKICETRPEDISDWNTLNKSLILGRKTSRVPSSTSDVIAGDVVGDFCPTSTYLYILVSNGGSPIWIRLVSSWTSGSFLAIANNLSDLADIPTARANLELEVGIDVQAWSANLDAIASLSNSTNLLIRSVGLTSDGGGTALTTGSKGYITVPYSGTIQKWYLAADQSGSCVIDIKRSSVSIVGTGNKPTLSSSQFTNALASGWTSTAITAEDIIEFNLDSASTITRVNLVMKVACS